MDFCFERLNLIDKIKSTALKEILLWISLTKGMLKAKSLKKSEEIKKNL